jgi:hypothetical protein
MDRDEARRFLEREGASLTKLHDLLPSDKGERMNDCNTSNSLSYIGRTLSAALRMLEAGFPLEEPFLQKNLNTLLSSNLESLRNKLSIPLPVSITWNS